MTGAFRFGALVYNQFDPTLQRPASGRAWAEQARQVESLGYSTLFLADHFDSFMSPLTGLTAAACATDTLRVGTMVLAADYRNVLALAHEAATLDLLSDGRLELGLGAGWKAEDYLAAGLQFDRPGTRIERLEETVIALKALFGGDAFRCEGKHVRIDAAAGSAAATQRPHPPILIGGGGRRLLGVAGRHADIVGVNLKIAGGTFNADALRDAGPDAMTERLGVVRAAAGSRFGDIELNIAPFAMVTDRPNDTIEQLGRRFAMDPGDVRRSPMFLVGSSDEIADTLIERREQYGFSYVVFTGGKPESLAGVVERLTGT